ncbi:MAG: putative 4-hydroxybenzoate polyprenyltransferase [Planctomycetes bacterium]|nr:putative 4-hydroxybenzoate polyprenyltransferase [Planctomycetota bacterium]
MEGLKTAGSPGPLPFLSQVRETAEMIKIGHSVFALPFALGSMALAMRAEGRWSLRTALWVVVCAVAARTAAMAQNRLLDARLDAANPRTASRALPAGRVTRGFVLALVLGSCAIFVAAAGQLNRLCLLLSPAVLLVLLTYPYAKRFTALCHVWLGVSLGLSPLGAWVAVRGSFDGFLTPLLLGGAVALWTAGFDLIYACQDVAHDRGAGLFSGPARLGVARALRLSAALHALCLALLALVYGANPDVSWLYGAGLLAAGALLLYEHGIVRPDDLSRVNTAFFTLNGLVSLVLGGLTIADALL